MKFSLVLATVGRVEELERFFSSLGSQNYPEVEVLLVDQNPDDRLRDTVAAASARFTILHLRSERGLSRARNTALSYVTGDVVAFPDDDCWYPPDVLGRVAHFFSENAAYDGLTGSCAEPTGRPARGWDGQAGRVTKMNVWRRAISFTIFLRRGVIANVDTFDETLGVGAGTPWGACEESDYLLRALDEGYRIHYDPGIVIFHPKALEKNDGEARRKACSYARGGGRVLRKHNYPVLLAWKVILTPLKGVAYSLVTGRPARAFLRWKMFTGALAGYRAMPQPDRRAAGAPRIGTLPRSDVDGG
jgi:glycosyltransferase involved in cell wall biosynthesis